MFHRKEYNHITTIQSENALLKQALNLTNFKLDSLQQDGRRENIQIHNVPESLTNRENGEATALQIVKALNNNLIDSEIQRAHRLLGQKEKECQTASHYRSFPILRKSNDFLHRKSHLNSHNKLKDVFIAEDLTPI